MILPQILSTLKFKGVNHCICNQHYIKRRQCVQKIVTNSTRRRASQSPKYMIVLTKSQEKMTQNFVCACLNVRVCHCAYLCVSLCVGHCVWAILCGPFCVDHFVCIIVFKRSIVFVIDCQCACYCVLRCFLLCTSLCVCIYCVCHSVSVRLFV